MAVAHRPDEHLDPAELDTVRATLVHLMTADPAAASDPEDRP